MYKMKNNRDSDQGFTLIELLVVMTIVAILSAIAVPQYQAYRARGFDIRALNDLRNVAVAEEAYFLDTEKYISCSDAACTALPGIAQLSKGVTLQIAGGATSFTGSATHSQGTGKTYQWDSDSGGLL